jgi:rubrerythrin
MSTNDAVAMLANGENTQMALVLAAHVQAEIQAACIMAERNPRDWDIVRERILKECKRSTFAAVARYKIPNRGEGFTIRFAEAAIQASKHIHVTMRTIWEDDEVRKLLVKVWDAQEMVSFTDEITIEKTVERRSVDKSQEVIRTRKNKAGDQLYIIAATEDDLLNKVNSAKSKSMRTNGLRLIPGWIQDQALQAIKATMKAEDAANPDAAKQKLFDAFGELGVQVEQIKTFIGHDAQTLTPRELQELRALFASIHDGETTMHAVLEEIAKEKSAARETEASATAGPVGTVAATPGKTTQSVKDKILARSRSTAVPGSYVAPTEMKPAVEGTVIPKTAEDAKKVVENLQAKAGQHPGLFSDKADTPKEGDSSKSDPTT